MPTENNTTTNGVNSTEKPTTPGSFGVNQKEIPIKDSLAQIISKRLNQTIPDNATLSEIDRITLEKRNAQTLLTEMNNLQAVSTLNKSPEKPKISNEIRTLPLEANVSQNLGETLRVPEQEGGVQNNTTNLSPVHIEQSTESVAQIYNLLPNFSKGHLSQIETMGTLPSQPETIPETPTQPLPVISLEKTHEKPSELSKVRSPKLMSKIFSTPRIPARITSQGVVVKSLSEQEKELPLIEQAPTSHDVIDTIIEKVAPNIDLHVEQAIEKISEVPQQIEETLERIQVSTYQRIGDIVGKLIGNDQKAFVTKIFRNLFSETPTPTGRQNLPH